MEQIRIFAMLSHTRGQCHIQSDTLPLQQAGAIVVHCSPIAEGQQGHSETEHWARAGSPPTKAVTLKMQLSSPDFAKIFQSNILAFQFTSMHCPLQPPPQSADKLLNVLFDEHLQPTCERGRCPLGLSKPHPVFQPLWQIQRKLLAQCHHLYLHRKPPQFPSRMMVPRNRNNTTFLKVIYKTV